MLLLLRVVLLRFLFSQFISSLSSRISFLCYSCHWRLRFSAWVVVALNFMQWGCPQDVQIHIGESYMVPFFQELLKRLGRFFKIFLSKEFISFLQILHSISRSEWLIFQTEESFNQEIDILFLINKYTSFLTYVVFASPLSSLFSFTKISGHTWFLTVFMFFRKNVNFIGTYNSFVLKVKW